VAGGYSRGVSKVPVLPQCPTAYCITARKLTFLSSSLVLQNNCTNYTDSVLCSHIILNSEYLAIHQHGENFKMAKIPSSKTVHNYKSCWWPDYYLASGVFIQLNRNKGRFPRNPTAV